MNLRRSIAVYKRHLHEYRHTPAEIFDVLYWPFFDLLAWGLLASFIQQGQVELPVPIAYLIGAALLWNVLWRTQNSICMVFLGDTWQGHILTVFASPITPAEYLVGAFMWTMTLLVVQTAIMAVLALVVFQFGVLSIGVALVPMMAALMLFASALSFVVLGFILLVGHGANSLAWGLAGIVQPLSAVYVPVAILPGWAQALSKVMPPAHLFEAMRAVLAGHAIPWHEFRIAMALDVVYLVGGVMFCRAMFGRLRRLGLATRYAF
jgi:ABC-2 type transport system permease protein